MEGLRGEALNFLGFFASFLGQAKNEEPVRLEDKTMKVAENRGVFRNMQKTALRLHIGANFVHFKFSRMIVVFYMNHPPTPPPD